MNPLGKPSRSVYVVSNPVIQPGKTAARGADPQHSGATFIQRGYPKAAETWQIRRAEKL